MPLTPVKSAHSSHHSIRLGLTLIQPEQQQRRADSTLTNETPPNKVSHGSGRRCSQTICHLHFMRFHAVRPFVPPQGKGWLKPTTCKGPELCVMFHYPRLHECDFLQGIVMLAEHSSFMTAIMTQTL